MKYLLIFLDTLIGFSLLLGLIRCIFSGSFENAMYMMIAFAWFIMYLHEVEHRKKIEKCLTCIKK